MPGNDIYFNIEYDDDESYKEKKDFVVSPTSLYFGATDTIKSFEITAYKEMPPKILRFSLHPYYAYDLFDLNETSKKYIILTKP